MTNKAKADVLITAPDKREHGEATIDLLAKVFSGWLGYFTLCDLWRTRMYHGHYDWDASQIAIADDKVVSHYGVWGYNMRIGTGRVKVGGIGVVATHSHYRKRGLVSKSAWASIEAMSKLRYDMTVLFGIDNFYDRFGYVRAWSDMNYKINLKDLPQEKPKPQLRRFALKQRDDIDEIYNRENRVFAGTAVRPTYIANRCTMPSHGYLWKDRRGKTDGYVVVTTEGGKFCCHEYGGDVEQILRAVAALGRKDGHREVHFIAPPYQSALCKRLRRSTCEAEIRYRKCGAAMIRTINLASTLRKISSELSRRLKKSPFSNWKGELLVSDPREKVLLKISGGKITVAGPKSTKHTIRGGEEIAQLIIGTDDPDEIIEQSGIKLAGDARKLVNVLFPNQYPTLAPWDRY